MLTLCGLPLLSLSVPADGAVEAPERNALLLLLHILKVGVGLLELHARDVGSGLPGVLEVNTQVAAVAASALLHEGGVVESVSLSE
jgi:hypothetical protein